MPVTVVEEFDAVKITNASIQFIEGGTQQPGTKFGCIGTIEGETELNEFVKNCEGVETKKIVRPIRINLTISGHIPVKVARDIFGLSNEDLKPGVYAYGADSKGKNFVLTADVIDEFQDITKLIAFSNCVSNTGLVITIENGADELAELEMEYTVMQDSNKKFYYEALVDELEDQTVVTQWHTQFTSDLVKATVPTP
ncbi:phage tail protein [Peribacillus psychrosaccharolyticus]|uniref:phage tail protein n=1 Tax=Peribacillus psychrosaccharolyticus TaxID=1407 RepID=UPI003D271274